MSEGVKQEGADILVSQIKDDYMNFRDIRQNSTVHLLDKTTMQYSEVKVDAVGMPHYQTPQVGQTAQAGQVVDVTIKGVPYVVACDNGIAYSDKVVFATDKSLLLPEVKRLKTEAENILAGVDKARETVTKCNGLLCDLDTVFKEKQETDRRIGAMESKINSLSEMLSNFINEFKK